jgi:tRNA (guanine26-N2/guanine27-N2)-dimethyltransferase
MPPLCGVNPKACLRKYGGKPMRIAYCHEIALRLLIGAAAKQAAIHEYAIKPIFSYYSDHYVRSYFLLERGAKKANNSLEKMGYIIHCKNCLNRKVVRNEINIKGRCDNCDEPTLIGGPMWIEGFADPSFCDAILEASKKESYWDNRIPKIIEIIRNEAFFSPTFYNLDKISSQLGVASLSTDYVIDKLNEEGYSSVRTHFDPRGIKTEASIFEIRNLLKE